MSYKWTNEKEDLLRANYGTCKVVELEPMFGCSSELIIAKANRMGISGVKATRWPEDKLAQLRALYDEHDRDYTAIAEAMGMDRAIVKKGIWTYFILPEKKATNAMETYHLPEDTAWPARDGITRANVYSWCVGFELKHQH